MVTDDVIKIKCPWCNAVLSVKNRADIDSKIIPCPVCKQKTAFGQYVLISRPKQPEVVQSFESTVYLNQGGAPVSQQPVPAVFGELHVQPGGVVFPLKQGKFIIGRKAPGSISDFQIETGASRRMSRQHVVIEVGLDPLNGVSYCLSLYKAESNPVKVNGSPLMYGDKVFITPGAVIELPEVSISLQAPDPDKTII